MSNRALLCLYQTLGSTGAGAHLMEKSQPLSEITLKDSRGIKSSKEREEEKLSQLSPTQEECVLASLSSCLQRECRGPLSCLSPFTCLSIDLLRTNERAQQPFHYPLTQWFSEPLFPRWVSSFCSLMHMAMEFYTFPCCWSSGIYFSFPITSFC